MSLCWMEFRRVCRSATYIVAVTALVLFAYFQNVLPPPALVVPPGAEASDGLAAHTVSEGNMPLCAMWTAFPARMRGCFAVAWGRCWRW